MAINLPIISEWNPAGIDKAINDFKKLETTGQKASFAIKKAAVPAGLALAALGAVAFDAVKAFAEDDAAAQNLPRPSAMSPEHPTLKLSQLKTSSPKLQWLQLSRTTSSAQHSTHSSEALATSQRLKIF